MAANPWLERRVLNYAHQGGAKEAPASSMVAMRRALEVGAHAIELDVHATSDRELIVNHDPIGDVSLAELRAVGVVTVREVLEAFPDTYLNFDIKQTAPVVEPYEDLLAALLREYGRADDVIVASFLDAATDAFKLIAPEVSTSAGTAAVAEFYAAVRDDAPAPDALARHHALQVPASFQDITLVDERFVTRAHAAGLAVHVWTIDDPDEMRRLLALDVDGIMTDRPSVLADVLSVL
jgi:glycerophosphoryl diester phosphodiesterase